MKSKPPMTIKTKPFDAARHFQSEADQLELISDALETRHAGYIAAALGTVAKARGMSRIAEETGLNRQGLYAALASNGNPSLDTILKVMHALGLEIAARRAREPQHA